MSWNRLPSWAYGLIFGSIIALFIVFIQIAENTTFSVQLILSNILYFVAPSIVFFIIGHKILNNSWSPWIKGTIIGLEVYVVTLIFSIPGAYFECRAPGAGASWCGILPIFLGVILLALIPLGLIIGLIYEFFHRAEKDKFSSEGDSEKFIPEKNREPNYWLRGAVAGLIMFILGFLIYSFTVENLIFLEIPEIFLIFGLPLIIVGALIGKLIGKSKTFNASSSSKIQ